MQLSVLDVANLTINFKKIGKKMAVDRPTADKHRANNLSFWLSKNGL